MGSVAAELQSPFAHRSVVEFKMLGAVEVVDAGGPLSLGGPQQRKVLAVLLSDPGTTLTYDRLLEVLWPDGQAPENARRTAISYVSRLRSALGDGWVTTTAAGYQLDISSASVDALRFVALVDGARDLPPERAIEVLDEALALWRGPVFGDLHGEWWALPAVSRLDELHLAAYADRIDALSAGGWDARALSEVQALVAAHPLRGPFVERLMRGLQASGRTDEALRAFQQHRNELIERTGLDPSDELIALDRSIAASGQLSIPADSVGRALRGYILRDVIGEGSFGTVYRATQPHVRARRGGQGREAGTRGRPDVHPPLRGRGQDGGPAGTSAHRPAVRLLARAGWCVSRVPTAARRDCRASDGWDRTVRPPARDPTIGTDRRRARLRPHGRGDPPRRQAGQHPLRRRRRGLPH